jgi:hypothetical protein
MKDYDRKGLPNREPPKLRQTTMRLELPNPSLSIAACVLAIALIGCGGRRPTPDDVFGIWKDPKTGEFLTFIKGGRCDPRGSWLIRDSYVVVNGWGAKSLRYRFSGDDLLSEEGRRLVKN